MLLVSFTDKSGNFWLFGGADSSGLFNDLWKYDPLADTWTWVNGSDRTGSPGNAGTTCVYAEDNEPQCRVENRASWTDADGNFYTFGGTGNDLWRYNVTCDQWVLIKGSEAKWAGGNSGTLLAPAPSNIPSGRMGSNAFTDLNGSLWLFGGYNINDEMKNDLWKFTLDTACAPDRSCIFTPPPPFIPNVFTPNGDGYNDMFLIDAESNSGFHVSIYDRWGKEVFHSDSEKDAWNGLINNNGNEASDGTYYYVLTLRYGGNKPSVYKGFLNLFRNK